MKFTAAAIAAIAAFFATDSLTNAAAVNGSHALAVREEGGFSATCRDLVITERSFISNTYFDLNAKCEKLDYRELNNQMQLGHCLTNDHGVLKWSYRGNFDKSCKHCDIRKIGKNEVKLGCWCEPAYAQTIVWSEINLDEGIRNTNGVLWCGRQMGRAW
ncbi:hypothetical protein LX36DRAFT_711381 [Colletotrichum falcatum]|nr:hypothetical protein LX36DRAFT_711381 [Colletotrichum falcatum]